MTTTITITADLARALMLRKDKRRSILRQMATPLLKTLSEEKLVEAAMANSRVKSNEINPVMTTVGIRDNMTIATLTSLIAGFQTPEQTLAALAFNMNPSEFGLMWKDTGSTDWTDTYFAMSKLVRALMDGSYTDFTEAVQHMNASGTFVVHFPPEMDKVMKDYGPDSASDDDDKQAAPAESAPAIQFPKVDEGKLAIANTVLEQLGIPKYAEITAAFNKMQEELTKAKTGPKGMSVTYNFVGQPALAANAGIPQGKMVMKRAFDVFAITGAGKEQFDFDVPTFEWDAPHPYVEDIDGDYQFQPVPLLRVLWALVTNQKAWLHGHTGTGKSTLIEQVSARLGWPMVRINFDSEITRMDLIGRDKLATVNGQTVTEFEDGILPKAMQMPCILLCDEMDFIRPDVAYVMQRALENKGLLITEDGGRLVRPDPMFRIVATANTKGSGDDTGRYMGARPQSGAFLDRYTCWVEVDYMAPAAAAKLIKAKVPTVDDKAVEVLRDYAKEHWVGFRNGDILQPLSPRGLLSAANAYTFYTGVMPKGEALKHAIKTTISERCTESDAQTIEGLVQRVM